MLSAQTLSLVERYALLAALQNVSPGHITENGELIHKYEAEDMVAAALAETDEPRRN